MNIVDRTIVVSLNAVTFFPFFSVFFSVFVGGFLGVVRLDNFKRIWRRHHCRLKAPNFDLRAALMIIEQWGFLSVPHLLLDSNIRLLWSSLRTCYTHIYFQAFISGVNTIHFLITLVCCMWDSNTRPSAFEANALSDCVIATAFSCLLRFRNILK